MDPFPGRCLLEQNFEARISVLLLWMTDAIRCLGVGSAPVDT